jgi:hypothetical protein
VNKLYVEPNDEITTVIERLKAAESDTVALIAPKGATLLQSVVNLKLARKAAQDAGKSIVIVTTDTIGKNLSVQLGIPVASSEKEAAAALRGEGADVIEEQAVVGGARIHRYYEEPVAEPAADAKAVEPILIPKKTLAGKAEPLPKEEKADDTSTVEVSEKPAKITTPEPLEPIRRVTPAALSGVEEKVTEAPIRRTPMEARTPVTVPSRAKRNTAPYFSMLGVLVILGAGAASYLYLPKTKAIVHVPSAPFSTTYTLKAAPTGADVQSETATTDATDTVSFTATGSKETGTPSSGTVSLYNGYSNQPATIPSGTVVTSGSISFTTTQPVTVPGASINERKIINGFASVTAQANTPGTAGNLTKADITPLSGAGYSLTGTVTASGGTSNLVTVVSDADITKAKADLAKKLNDDAIQKLNDSLKGQTIQADASGDTFTADNPTVSVTAGDQVASGTVTGTGHLSRFVVKTEEISRATNAKALAAAPSGTVRHVDPVAIQKFVLASDKASAAITVSVSGKDAPITPSESELASILKGKSLSDASSAIAAKVPGATVSLVQSPGWWPLKKYPTLTRFLEVAVSYE